MSRSISNTDLSILRELLGRSSRDLEAFLTVDGDLCDLPLGVREAASPYLSTWVAGPLSQAIRLLDRLAEDRKEGQR